MTPWMEFFLGSETHIYAMAEELIKQGHEVSIFTYLKKVMWEFMKGLDVEILEDEVPDRFDIAIINGNNCFLKAPKSAFKIFISNGVMPSVEHPLPGADAYVSISEEVKNNLKKYDYSSIIIRNGVDHNRFKSDKKISKNLKTVLLLNNQMKQDWKDFHIINNVCNNMNLTLLPVGLGFSTTQWEIEKLINEADLVLSMGRGIYEAMACSRNAIIIGYGRMVGFVDNKTYPNFVNFNCAGRSNHPLITEENLILEFNKYSQEQGDKNREISFKYNNIENTVQNFLDLYINRNLNI